MKSIAIFHSMQLGDNFVQGGVQKVCLNLVAGFDSAGWDAAMLQHVDNAGIREQLEANDLREIPIEFEVPTLNNDYGGLSYSQFIGKGLRLARSIVRLRLQSFEFDAIILNDVTSIFFNKAFRAKRKFLFLHTERFAGSRMAKLALSLWPTGDVTLICPTDELMDLAAKLFPNNEIKKFFTPVFTSQPDLGRYLPKPALAPDQPIRLCYIGRISPIKNISAVLHMAADLSQISKVVLDVFGSAFSEQQVPYEKAMHALGEELNATHPNVKIAFKGRTDDPVATFADYDYSIILSDGEAIPLAGLESLSSGTPIIAWDAAGVNELVLDGISGVVVEQDKDAKRAKVTPEFLNRLVTFDPQVGPLTDLLSKFSIPGFVANFE